MAIKCIAEPITTPVLDSELIHAGDLVNDGTAINAINWAATRACQKYAGRQFNTATYELWLDAFPNVDTIYLPLPPLQVVNSVTYLDANGDEQIFASANYIEDTVSEPGRIALVQGVSWPTTRPEINSVCIEFVCGYEESEYGISDVPADIKSAIKLLAGHLYEHKEMVSDERLIEVPFTMRALLDPYKVMRF